MSVFEAAFLGLVQALTEFLPVSSSGHLLVFPELLGWDPHSLAFDVALHAGTASALLVYFFSDFYSLMRTRSRDLGAIIVGIIPAGIVGFLFEDLIGASLRSPSIVMTALVVGAGGLVLAERFVLRHTKAAHLVTVGYRNAFIIGCAQTLALIPGMSRSGITLTAGMMLGISRETSARFSFLMSAPLIMAATLLTFPEALRSPEWEHEGASFVVGFLVSAVCGYLIIRWFLDYVREHTLYAFALYRVLFALLLFLYLQ